MWFDRVMDWVGDDDADTRLSKLGAFQAILVFHVWAECWEVAIDYFKASFYLFIPGLLIPAGLGLVALFPRTRRLGFTGLAILTFIGLFYFFPHAGNHNLLVFLFCGFSSFFNLKNEDEQELFIRAARWIIILVFFYSGLQKLAHGYYFHGELFAYYISISKNYEAFFKHFLPPEELARLATFNGTVGEGPYRLEYPAVLLMSNSTYVLEMALPVLLVRRRTRQAAAVAVAVTSLMIQLAARELFFFGLFMNGLFLFFKKDANRKLMPVFAAYYLALIVIMVLMSLKVIEGFWFG